MSADYSAAREDLRAAEVDLMLQREAVAAMRRSLPPGPLVNDYTFDSIDGPVALSDLFHGERPLVLYHFMLGDATSPCPMCAMWTDGWAAIDSHLAENIDLVLVSSANVEHTRATAADRGWDTLRWVSAASNSFKRDIGGETEDGHLMPFISVYEKTSDGPRMTYSGGAHIEGDHWRGVDLLSPIWHFLDLTQHGRGDWMPSNR